MSRVETDHKIVTEKTAAAFTTLKEEKSPRLDGIQSEFLLLSLYSTKRLCKCLGTLD